MLKIERARVHTERIHRTRQEGEWKEDALEGEMGDW